MVVSLTYAVNISSLSAVWVASPILHKVAKSVQCSGEAILWAGHIILAQIFFADSILVADNVYAARNSIDCFISKDYCCRRKHYFAGACKVNFIVNRLILHCTYRNIPFKIRASQANHSGCAFWNYWIGFNNRIISNIFLDGCVYC